MATTYITDMPFDIQETIWKSYYTYIVLVDFKNKSTVLNVIRLTNWGIAVNQRWELNWHQWVPLKSTVSGQRQIGIEYDEWFPHSYSDSDSESEYDDGSDSDSEAVFTDGILYYTKA